MASQVEFLDPVTLKEACQSTADLPAAPTLTHQAPEQLLPDSQSPLDPNQVSIKAISAGQQDSSNAERGQGVEEGSGGGTNSLKRPHPDMLPQQPEQTEIDSVQCHQQRQKPQRVQGGPQLQQHQQQEHGCGLSPALPNQQQQQQEQQGCSPPPALPDQQRQQHQEGGTAVHCDEQHEQDCKRQKGSHTLSAAEVRISLAFF